MASFEITGKLKVKNEIQQVSEKFTKREFVIVADEETQYPQMISFQLTQTKCELLDNYNIGDSIKVSFNLRGREWTGNDGITKYFNSLEAWKLEKVSSSTNSSTTENNENTTNTFHSLNTPTPAQQNEVINNEQPTDDLPF